MFSEATTTFRRNKRRIAVQNLSASSPTSVSNLQGDEYFADYEADPSIFLIDKAILGTPETKKHAISIVQAPKFASGWMSLLLSARRCLYARSKGTHASPMECCHLKTPPKNKLLPLLLKIALFIVLMSHSLPKILFWENSNEIRNLHENPEDIIIDVSRRRGAVSDEKCSLYLAPSSIPNVGLGVFASHSFKEGESIDVICNGPSVVVTDPFNSGESDDGWPWANEMFMWGVNYANKESDTSMETITNLGSMVNYHPFLDNIQLLETEENYDDSILSRFNDPGAGAVSYHMGRRWHATRDIEAGEEFFNDYGEEFFTDWLQDWDVDLSSFLWEDDYLAAASLLKKNRKKEFNGEPTLPN